MSDEWMQTYTGAFDFLDMKPEDITIQDIAHSLSMQCRFAGHVPTHYSVAEHSVRIAWELPHRYKLQGLLHDASEAYCQDVVRPFKRQLGESYATFEKAVQKVIGDRFGCELVRLPEKVIRMDNILLATERRDLLGPTPQGRKWAPLPPPLERTIHPWDSTYARHSFLQLFTDLTGIAT